MRKIIKIILMSKRKKKDNCKHCTCLTIFVFIMFAIETSYSDYFFYKVEETLLQIDKNHYVNI